MNVNQLIILGNGFDLQCGLKSRFIDFFEAERLPKIQESPRFDMIEDVDEYISSEDRLTFWDLVFAYDAGCNWCSIETKIEDWVTDRLLTINPIHYRRHIENKLKNKKKPISDAEYLHTIDGATIADYVSVIKKNWNNDVQNTEFMNFLMSELNVLECRFAKYLQAKTKNRSYRSRCTQLLKKILADKVPAPNDSAQETTILDFNYTKPCWAQNALPEHCSITNIHGRQDGEIIFGIDAGNNLKNAIAAPFTKTYRLLSMNTEPKKGLSRALMNTPEKGGATIIKFYGHSLASEDHSYFQSIFDALDIYQSQTELVFYYAPDRAGDHYKKANAVTKLLAKYGDTLDNEAHGKNLMHKLLIEGRLSVRPLGLENHQADPD